jgi:hypothetical protein
VRLEVLTATSVKMASLLDVAPCSVVDTRLHVARPTSQKTANLNINNF